MKLAIAVNDSQVHEFFGSCNTFLIVTLENGQIHSIESITNATQTHKLRPAFLRSLGVDALIIKGLGLTAYELLIDQGIAVYTCEPIPADAALSLFLKGQLSRMNAPEGAHC
jgi:predicted Fe-Mo cluster-binding NifX family protein